MDLKKQLSGAFGISLLFAIGFGLIALFISANHIGNFDNRVIDYFQSFNTPGLTTFMKLFSFIGSGPIISFIIIFAIIFFYAVLKHRSELVLLVGVVVGSALLNLILKLIFHRARPTLNRLVEVTGYSFPSGHSMAAFTLYGILSFLLWKHISSYRGRSLLIIISILMISMIGISRIYLGVHYPSDVVGGFLASGTWLLFSIWTFQKYQERKFLIKRHQA